MQSYYGHSDSEVTLKDMGEIDQYQSMMKENKMHTILMYCALVTP